MLTPRKLIAFLTLALIFASTFGFAADGDLGPGWTQFSDSSGVTVYYPTGDNPNGTINSDHVLTQGGKDYYKLAGDNTDKFSVDSSGRVARTLLEVSKVTRADGSQYVYSTQATFYTEPGAASAAVWDKVKADTSSFPTLSSALSSATGPAPNVPGKIVKLTGGATSSEVGKNYILGTKLLRWWQVPPFYGTPGTWGYSSYAGGIYYVDCYDGGGGYVDLERWSSGGVTTQPPTSDVTNYTSLASAVMASGSAGLAEIDNLIAQNPDSFQKSYTPSANDSLTSPPAASAITSQMLQKIYVGSGSPAGSSGGPVIDPTTGEVVLPDTFGIPSAGGSGGGPSSDIYGSGYTPGFNNSSYGSDIPGGADFGIRLSQFMTDLRGSSLFSLPTSILGNIPSSGTSAISFDGGQFGQQSFDFAAFSNQLMVIRSVLLLCFSLLSIRIVTLKR